MKIWTNNKFEGHYPVGVGAVVVAEDAEDAAVYLSVFLHEVGLPDALSEEMEEMLFVEGQVSILADGNY